MMVGFLPPITSICLPAPHLFISSFHLVQAVRSMLQKLSNLPGVILWVAAAAAATRLAKVAEDGLVQA
jgi:hypothetical protein